MMTTTDKAARRMARRNRKSLRAWIMDEMRGEPFWIVLLDAVFALLIMCVVLIAVLGLIQLLCSYPFWILLGLGVATLPPWYILSLWRVANPPLLSGAQWCELHHDADNSTVDLANRVSNSARVIGVSNIVVSKA